MTANIARGQGSQAPFLGPRTFVMQYVAGLLGASPDPNSTSKKVVYLVRL